jgi:hypothetical protein
MLATKVLMSKIANLSRTCGILFVLFTLLSMYSDTCVLINLYHKASILVPHCFIFFPSKDNIFRYHLVGEYVPPASFYLFIKLQLAEVTVAQEFLSWFTLPGISVE